MSSRAGAPDTGAEGDTDVTDGPVWAIVLAAGHGRRFGARPKQFERVGGERMVDRTVLTARRTCDRVVLVLPPGRPWDGPPVDVVAYGGEHASDTVRAGLAMVPDDAGVVVVCDPAHPLATDALFHAVIDAVRAGADGAVPTVAIHDVIQRVRDGVVTGTVAKDGLVITQSPQAFRPAVLRAVHSTLPKPVENSGLVVAHGHRVVAVPGDQTNLHVTTPEELAVVDEIAGFRKS